MRIAYFTHYFPPERNAPAARVHELSRALCDAGHAVTVVTGQPSHPHGVIYPGYRAASVRREVIDGIDVLRCPTLPVANRGLTRALGFVAMPPAQALVALARAPKVDVVIATSPQPLTGLAGLAFARARRVPFFFEVRDLWPQDIVDIGVMSARHPFIRALFGVERLLYREARGIISVTDSFVERFVAHGVSRERIVVIKNGIDARLFARPHVPAPLRERLEIPDSALVVLYCGTLGLPQDVGLLARAAARMRGDEAHFVIVGDGADRAAIAREVAALEVGDRVHLLPAVARAEVPGLLTAADVAAVLLRDIPAYAGVLPSKMFEAMAAGTPLALGVRGEAAQLLSAADAGVSFPPGDPDALVAALRELARRGPAERAKIGARGRAYVLEHHDRRQQARALAEFLAARR